MPQVVRDYLYQLEHPTTKKVMTFNYWGTGMESEFLRPGTTYVLPGSNSPLDSIGDEANPMQGRTVTFNFLRPYRVKEDNTLETFTEAMDEFRRMVIHGKRMTAVKMTTTGKLRYARFKLESLPDKPNQDDGAAAIFSATFNMNPPWWEDLYSKNVKIYDLDDLTYDVGDNYYDDDGYHLPLVSNTLEIDMSEATLPHYGATFALYGVFGGSLGSKITNISVSPRYSITVNAKILDQQMLVIEAATEAVRLNALPRPDLMTLPNGQFDVMLLEAGIVNELVVECLGTGQTAGGYITIDAKQRYG